MFYSSLAMNFKTRSTLPFLLALSGLLACTPAALAQNAPAAKPTVAEALAFIDKAERDLGALNIEAGQAAWVQETYITDDTVALSAAANDRLIARQTALISEARKFDGLTLPPDAARKLMLLKLSIGLPAPSDPALRAETTQKAAQLDAAYGKGKYCPDANPDTCLGIDEIGVKMAQSRDPKELATLWAGWHAVGVPMRGDYARLAELSNKGARELGFADTGVLWRSQYDMTPEEFQSETERLWKQVEPLYLELHTYVRRKLIEKYGDAARRPDGMIPGDQLGNMWAQEWGNTYDLLGVPENKGGGVNVTELLDDYALTRGAHSLKLGADLRWERLDALQPRVGAVGDAEAAQRHRLAHQPLDGIEAEPHRPEGAGAGQDRATASAPRILIRCRCTTMRAEHPTPLFLGSLQFYRHGVRLDYVDSRARSTLNPGDHPSRPFVRSVPME